jgi:glycosyltransferase involved in cell wall biosynthesis
MDFSIITPSFRSSKWLKLCIASVADQQGASFEHIVQDSCSDDGTQDWLPGDKRVRAFIEKDQGMYDAANRGFRRGTGKILAYLNCDEQLLPGGLQAVKKFADAHPEADVILTDTVVTDAKGAYLCHRLSLVPIEHEMWIRFPVLSCGLFVRRRVIHDLGMFVDTQWRDLGDFFWVLALVQRGVKFAILRHRTSVFADTGENMNLKPNARREMVRQWELTPPWVKLLRLPLAVQYRLRLALRGSLFQGPYDYSLYTMESAEKRVTIRVGNPTSFWRGRSIWTPPKG